MESYRELFPVTKDRAYLNHASFAPASTRVVQAVLDHITDHSENADDASSRFKEQRERTRQKMAVFVGAEANEIAVVKNTPEALSLVAAGLTWRSGDRVIICDLEFPANVFPWLNLSKQGVETTIIRSRDGRVPREAVIDAIDERTRVVSLSWVEFSNGYRNDLRTIGRECRERGVYFCVDAIQGLGALRFDVRDLNIDFFGAASHKWLCGPAGVGWFYCRNEVMDQLEVKTVGQSSYRRGPDTSWFAHDLELWTDARRFEPGITNYPGIAGLEAALDLFAEIGMDEVEARVKYLSDLVAEGLSTRGFRLGAPRDGEQWSGIVSFSSDHNSSEELLERLDRAGVRVTLREGMIRVAPHFYNNVEDLDRLFDALP